MSSSQADSLVHVTVILDTDETMLKTQFKEANMPAKVVTGWRGKDKDSQRGHIIGPS